MSLCHTLVDIFETLFEFWRNALLVAYAKIFEVEWSWMACFCTHFSPFGVHTAVCPFDEVESLFNPFVHLCHGNGVLSLVFHSPTSVCALTAYTTWKYWQWLHAHIFAELEILVITYFHRLVVAPCVLQLLTLMFRAYGIFPTICVPETISTAVYYTSSGETHETRTNGLKCLGKVFAYAVTMICVLWHERHLVDVHHACFECEYLKHCCVTVFCGCDGG